MRAMPFWVHQLAEYVIGLGLIAQAVQGPSATLPVIVGGVIVVSAAVADGPLAGWKGISRPGHRAVDIVVALGCLLLAVLPWSGADGTSRVVLVVIAALFGLLLLRTSYAPRVVRAPRSRGEVAEDVGRSAGRLAAKGLRAYRDRRPPSA